MITVLWLIAALACGYGTWHAYTKDEAPLWRFALLLILTVFFIMRVHASCIGG